MKKNFHELGKKKADLRVWVVHYLPSSLPPLPHPIFLYSFPTAAGLSIPAAMSDKQKKPVPADAEERK